MSNKIKTYKKDLDYSYTLGVFLTIQLLELYPQYVTKVINSSNSFKNSGLDKILELCKKHNIPIETSDKCINKLSPKGNCYSIGVFNKYKEPLKPNENHIVLVNPSNSGNLGTIIRSSLGFGIKNIAIIRPGVDIFDPKVIRASMGAIFHVSFEYYDSFNDYINNFKSHNIYTFMLNGKKKLSTLDEVSKEPFSLVFGNEASGLSEEFKDIGTSIVIPHSQDIDSLNLSVAVSIAEYQFTKNNF